MLLSRTLLLTPAILAAYTVQGRAESDGHSISATSADERSKPSVVDEQGRSIPVTQGAAPGYVPDSACQSCHPHVYSVFQSHGMARSFYMPSVDNVMEDFGAPGFYHAASNRFYETTQRDGRFFQLRYQIDGEGNRINVIERSIDYVMGSGNHVRTYLTRTPSGEIYQLPVCWYTQEQGWGMNPGYDSAFHPGFTRQVGRECMACHNAFPETPIGSDRRDAAPRFPADLPEGIGCQRCHGPGAEHIRVALSEDASIRTMRESIVNPGRLDRPLREDVCMQCHLQPTSHANSFARLDGHGEYSYRPGRPLADRVMVVDYNDEADRASRFEINHHPYRLHRSKCYIESKGGMDCLTCHDPHRKIPEAERADHYRKRCLTCHKLDDCGFDHGNQESERMHSDASQPNDCVTCHMPARRTQDVVRVVMTDHLIRKEAPPEQWLEPLSEHPPALEFPPEPYYADRAPPQPMLDVYLAMFGTSRGDPIRVHVLKEAIDVAETTAFDPVYALANGYGEIGATKRAREAFRNLTQRFPDRPRLWANLAYFEAQSGQLDDALIHARHALSADPVSPEPHALLGGILLSMGETAKAIAHLKESVRLRPVHVDALINLGHAFAGRGELSLAADQFRAALAVDPTDVDAYAHIGVVLIAAGELDEALRYTKHGLRVTDANATLIVTHAAALALNRETEGARAAVSQAQEKQADETSVKLLRALCDAAAGERALARNALNELRPMVVGRPEATSLQRILVHELAGAVARLEAADK